MKKLALNILLLFVSFASFSQVIAMANGTFNACGGGFLDSGGEGSSGYSANENITTSICPDGAGLSVYVTFTVFNFGTGDQITVYDGSSTADPLIGTYSGNDLQGQTIAASIGNATGCLTFVISTDAADNGWFASSVSCEPPCDNPEAIGDIGAASPILICQGDQVTFDGTGSQAAAGFNIQDYYWVDLNGDTTTQATFTQTFPNEGEYVYKLIVVDDNECQSVNFENFRVWVSTTPSFAGTATDAFVCQGGDVCIDGMVEPQTFIGGIPTYGGGDTWLPDNVGECFTSTLDYTGAFPDGATLDDINDLLGICMFVEHSFIGDLVITITSPSGEVVTLHEQGGGGTYLGEPIDTGDPNDGVGECWEYCFTPNSVNGTMAAEALNYTTLPSDDYASVYALSGLLGSELNGLWQLDICDMWGSDDGYLCDWSLSLNPDLFIVEPTEFTPVIGSDINSSYWDGFTVGTLSADGNQLCLNGVPNGTYNATYNVIDDFGCEYSIDAEIEIASPTTFTLGPDIVTCGTDIINLGATIDNFTGDEWDYSINWTPWDAVASSWEMNTTYDPAYGDVEIVVEIYEYNNVNWQDVCPTTDTISISVGAMNAVQDIPTIADGCEATCTGEATIQLIDPGQTYTYLWDDGQTTQTATGLCGGDHTVIVTDASGCEDEQTITIDEETLYFITSTDTLVCLDSDVTFTATDDLNLGLHFEWDYNGLQASGTTSTFQITQAGQVTVVGTNADNCTQTNTIDVTVNAPLLVSLTPDEQICPGETVTISPTVNGGMGSFTFLWDSGETSSSIVVTPDSTGQYVLSVTDECNATVQDSLLITVVEIPEWGVVPSAIEGCSPLLVNYALTDSTDVSNVTWDVGNPMNMNSEFSGAAAYILPGNYSVNVSLDYQGCANSISYIDTIEVFANPAITVTTDAVVHALMFPEFCFQSSTTGNEIVSYDWDFGGFGTSEEQHPCFTFSPEEACHNVVVNIVDTNSCVASDSIEVCLKPELAVYIPNAFSPDGNGLNDYFLPNVSGHLLGTYQFLIYDRWGNLVFNTDETTAHWDGKDQVGGSGADCPVGVYVWKMVVHDLDEQEIQKTGLVTIIR